MTIRYYSGGYEKIVKPSLTRELHYITAYGRIVAIYEKTSTPTTAMYYVHTDHLGSINCITDSVDAIVQETSYTAWGRRRNPSTWAVLSSTPANLITSRGFTGHEHIDEFNLINMNGRIYDPILCRFLSPDQYVGNAGFTQDYNRYSYVLNDPLSYTDPSGYLLDDLKRNNSYEGGSFNYRGDLWYFKDGDFFMSGGGGEGMGGAGYYYNYSMQGYYYNGSPVSSREVHTEYISRYGTTYVIGWHSISRRSWRFWDYHKTHPWITTNIGLTETPYYEYGPKLIPPIERLIAYDYSRGIVNYGGWNIASYELRRRLNEFANQTGFKIRVIGGNRSVERNKAVGGVKGSRHLVGDAVDIKVIGVSNRELALRAHDSKLFNTSIYYPDYSIHGIFPEGSLRPHVHLDLNPNHYNLLLIYKILDGSNKYVPWNP